MKDVAAGKVKIVLNYLGFLIEDYSVSFQHQAFSEYLGFAGPIDTYSFYNENGCFTIHHVVQRGEIGWFISKSIYQNQYDLLQCEINQRAYIQKQCYSWKTHLKTLAMVIKKQLAESNSFFGISI